MKTHKIPVTKWKKYNYTRKCLYKIQKNQIQKAFQKINSIDKTYLNCSKTIKYKNI